MKKRIPEQRSVINKSSIVQRKPNMLFNEIDNEVVMLSVENGEYYGLDETGSHIWKLIEKPVEVTKLIDNLLQAFDVDQPRCTEDTLQYLNELAEKKLLIIHEKQE